MPVLFAIFGPHFHQLFATKRVKPWKIWKISWFRPVSGENRTTSVGNSKEIGLFLENFWKISQKRWNLKTGNGNRSTSGEFWHFRLKNKLPVPVEAFLSFSDPILPRSLPKFDRERHNIGEGWVMTSPFAYIMAFPIKMRSKRSKIDFFVAFSRYMKNPA